MPIRGRNRGIDPSGRLAAVVSRVPASARPLLLACLYRDAVDRIVVTKDVPTPFIRPRTAVVQTNTEVIFSRDPSAPLFTRTARTSTNSFARMQALLEALHSAGHRPVADHGAASHSKRRVIGSWSSHEIRLASDSEDIQVIVFALTGGALATNGELAPTLWRGGLDGPVDYTGARIRVTAKHGHVDIELGEIPESVASIMKALQISEGRRGSPVDFSWPAEHLNAIPWVLTGTALFLIRGAIDAIAQPLTALDIAIREKDVELAMKTVGEFPGIRLHPTPAETFSELQALSTRHSTSRGGMNLGPVHDPVRMVDLRIGSHSITA